MRTPCPAASRRVNDVRPPRPVPAIVPDRPEATGNFAVAGGEALLPSGEGFGVRGVTIAGPLAGSAVDFGPSPGGEGREPAILRLQPAEMMIPGA